MGDSAELEMEIRTWAARIWISVRPERRPSRMARLGPEAVIVIGAAAVPERKSLIVPVYVPPDLSTTVSPGRKFRRLNRSSVRKAVSDDLPDAASEPSGAM